MMRTPRFRLVALGALLAIAGCSESDHGEEPLAVEDAAGASNPLTLAEFTAAFDPATGELGIELLPIEAWERPPRPVDGVTTVPQALWCALSDATVGGLVQLTTVPDSVGRTPDECGLPTTGTFAAWGAFCADITVRSRSASVIVRPMAEITSVDPGYEGYRFAETAGQIGVDPATLDGPNPPSELKGLFAYPDLDVGESATSTWAFHNAGGAFSFRGRIVAEAYETCNGRDDDCDGLVDEGVGCFSSGHSCDSDFDCASGNCTVGGTCGPSQCEDRVWNGSETDVDCGGPCQPCLDGADCLDDDDCRSGNCRTDRCVPFRYPTVGEVVITEIMVDPGATTDQDMEWFEIRSIAGESVDLDGCRIADASGAATVLSGVTIDAGQYRVFAHSLVPSTEAHDTAWAAHRAVLPADTVLYNGFTFGNGGDSITLSCPLDGVTLTAIDTLAYGPGLATDRKAVQLHTNSTTATANDTPLALCDARQVYHASLTGTPGAPNPSCDVSIMSCVFGGPFDVDAPVGQPLRYFGRVRALGITDVTTGTDRAPARFHGQVGFGPNGSTPSNSGWQWTTAAGNPMWSDPTGLGFDESMVLVAPEFEVGDEKDVAFRWTGNGGGSWTYCTGRGDLSVMAPAVAPSSAGEAVFSEVMADPNGPDAVGEWFEIANLTGDPIDLSGCRVGDGVSNHIIESSVFVPAGQVALFALESGSASGLTGVDYEYSGLVLANAGRTLTLECRADSASPWVQIDRTTYAAGDVTTGVALQLDPNAADSESRDLAGAWCLAPVSPTFGPAPGQRGSPGNPNPACYTVGQCRVQHPTSLLDQAPTAHPTVFGRVFVDRLTARTSGVDTAPAVVAQVGFGADGTSPSEHGSWQWVDAAPNPEYGPTTVAFEADRDEYVASFAMPPGSSVSDVAYRFSADGGGTWTYCDLDTRGTGGGDGSANGYAAADSVPLTTAPTHTIGRCNLQSPVEIVDAWAGDEVTVSGRLFVAGLTELPGPNPAPTIVGQLGWGPDGADPDSWPASQWTTATPTASCVDCGTDDEYQVTLTLPTAGDGPYDHAFRFSGDGGVSWTYCDRNGEAYLPAEAGHMAPLAWTPEYCHLGWDDATITGRRGQAVDIDAFVFAWSERNGEPGPQCGAEDAECLTTRTGNTDAATDLFGEIGWGAGDDPTEWTSWTRATPAPAGAYGPGAADYEVGNDKYTARIGLPPEGTWSSAVRFTGDGGRTWTYCGAHGVWTEVGDLLGTIETRDAVSLPYAENFTTGAGQGFWVTTPGTFTIDTSLVSWTVDLALANATSTATRGVVDWLDTRFEVQDVDGYAVWMSPVIDISAAATVRADVVLSEPNVLEAGDGVMVGYRLDGGGFFLRDIAFDDFTSLTDTYFTSGDTLQVVVVFASDSATDDLHIESVTVAAAASPAPSPTEISLPFLESFPADGAYSGALGAVTQESIGNDTAGPCTVVGGALQGQDLNGICTYRSKRIDIDGVGPVYVRLEVDSFGALEANDGVMIGYSVDGRLIGIGSWSGLGNSLFALSGASDFGPTVVTGGGVEGRVFQVVVVMMNDAPDEGFRVDDIQVCAGAPCPEP